MRIPSIGAAVFGGGSKLVAISLAMRGAGAFLTLRPIAAFFPLERWRSERFCSS
jgi:hypothetical protein